MMKIQNDEKEALNKIIQLFFPRLEDMHQSKILILLDYIHFCHNVVWQPVSQIICTVCSTRYEVSFYMW